MTANNVDQELRERVSRLEAELYDVRRFARVARLNVRDLADAELRQVVDGQVAVYRSATGKWHPHSVVPVFNKNGPLTVGLFDDWPPPFNMRLRRLYLRLTVVGTTATTARLLRNGSPVTGASVTVAASSFGNGANFDQVFFGPETDRMALEITAAGAGAKGLVGVVT